MRKNAIILITAIAVLSGCYYDNEESLYPNMVILPDIVTYSEHIQPVLNGNCAISGCHVSGTGLPVLNTYDGARTLGANGKLTDRLITQMDMPPIGPLSTRDQKLIEKWVNTGFNQ